MESSSEPPRGGSIFTKEFTGALKQTFRRGRKITLWKFIKCFYWHCLGRLYLYLPVILAGWYMCSVSPFSTLTWLVISGYLLCFLDPKMVELWRFLGALAIACGNVYALPLLFVFTNLVDFHCLLDQLGKYPIIFRFPELIILMEKRVLKSLYLINLCPVVFLQKANVLDGTLVHESPQHNLILTEYRKRSMTNEGLVTLIPFMILGYLGGWLSAIWLIAFWYKTPRIDGIERIALQDGEYRLFVKVCGFTVGESSGYSTDGVLHSVAHKTSMPILFDGQLHFPTVISPRVDLVTWGGLPRIEQFDESNPSISVNMITRKGSLVESTVWSVDAFSAGDCICFSTPGMTRNGSSGSPVFQVDQDALCHRFVGLTGCQAPSLRDTVEVISKSSDEWVLEPLISTEGWKQADFERYHRVWKRLFSKPARFAEDREPNTRASTPTVG